jgi:hypothetical protein
MFDANAVNPFAIQAGMRIRFIPMVAEESGT